MQASSVSTPDRPWSSATTAVLHQHESSASDTSSAQASAVGTPIHIDGVLQASSEPYLLRSTKLPTRQRDPVASKLSARLLPGNVCKGLNCTNAEHIDSGLHSHNEQVPYPSCALIKHFLQAYILSLLMLVVDLITRHKNALSETTRSQHFSLVALDRSRKASQSLPNLAKAAQVDERPPTPSAMPAEAVFAFGNLQQSYPLSGAPSTDSDSAIQPSPNSHLGTPSDGSEALSVDSQPFFRGSLIAQDFQALTASKSDNNLSVSQVLPNTKAATLPHMPVVPWELHTPPRIPRDDVTDSR